MRKRKRRETRELGFFGEMVAATIFLLGAYTLTAVVYAVWLGIRPWITG